MTKIKSILKPQGCTQIWLPTQLEVTKGTISSWCNNVIQPSLEKLYRVAETLDVYVTELLTPNKIKNDQ